MNLAQPNTQSSRHLDWPGCSWCSSSSCTACRLVESVKLGQTGRQTTNGSKSTGQWDVLRSAPGVNKWSLQIAPRLTTTESSSSSTLSPPSYPTLSPIALPLPSQSPSHFTVPEILRMQNFVLITQRLNNWVCMCESVYMCVCEGICPWFKALR